MELKELQRKVKELSQKLNLVNSPELCGLDLASEAGEIAKEILELTNYGRRDHIYNPDLERELGDALYSLIAIANIYDIDLEEKLLESLEKYKKREDKRKAIIEDSKVKLEPIVLAKNFLSINSIVGCRNNCIYCYKHGWDIKNKCIPTKIYDVSNILKNLKKHRYFHENIPLAIHNSATDPFQEGVVENTFEILDGLEEKEITNIVGLITKEYLSKEIITRLESYKNIRPVIFITFSFLPEKYEKVVNDRRLESMKNLSESNLKKILYYRPIISGINDSEEIVQKIVELGEKYFDCIVRSSLKLDINTIENMAKHGVHVDPRYDIGLNIHDSLKKMIPESRQRVDKILHTGSIPCFKKTSCALSWLFNQPDYNCQWIRERIYCSKSCPSAQKGLCLSQSTKIPTKEQINELLNHLSLNLKYSINGNHVLVEGDNIFYSDIKYMRMVLNFPVLISINGEKLTAEEYDTKHVNSNRKEIRKMIKKLGITNY